jgi:hypothetical protein
MDHVTALNQQSVERYLLGEMSTVEAEEFEQHYFDCQECALAVEEGQIWSSNARAVLAGEIPETRRQESRDPAKRSLRDSLRDWWRQPILAFPVAAAVLLAAFSAYQGMVVIPGLRHQLGEARVLPAFLLIAASRGAASEISVPSGTPSLAVEADVPPDARFPEYICELSAKGHRVFRVEAPAPAEGQPITILIPASELPAGQDELDIYGADSTGHQRNRVSTFTFALSYH